MMVTKTIIGAYSAMKMEQMFVMVERIETGFVQKAKILLLSFSKGSTYLCYKIQQLCSRAKQNFQGSFKTGINFPYNFTECYARRRKKENTQLIQGFKILNPSPKLIFCRRGERGEEGKDGNIFANAVHIMRICMQKIKTETRLRIDNEDYKKTRKSNEQRINSQC